ncbi:hypothetical protein [Endozoicomonas numazuensis]|uniref:Uncharacterized protein n=1 Tax=Endozoicomonas numazuensis TaxID=1137799 RepID=A0A081NLL1_9GAMM|nr:hypothetical protein [Endozoicomonas numazuensis]KEQ19334.1 hypothetical protein GZ78_05030 [Endozoicomonas numazuensis]
MLSCTRLLLFIASFIFGLHSSLILADQKEKPDNESEEEKPGLELSNEEPETTICLETLTIQFSKEKEFVKSLTRFLQETDQECIELTPDQNHPPYDSKFNKYVIPDITTLPLPQNQRRIIHGRLLDCLLNNRSCLNVNKQAMGYWHQDGFSGGLFIPSMPEQNDPSQETLMSMFVTVFRNLVRLFLMLPAPGQESSDATTEQQRGSRFRPHRNNPRRKAERKSRREESSNPYSQDNRNRDRSRSPIRKPPKPDNS